MIRAIAHRPLVECGIAKQSMDKCNCQERKHSLERKGIHMYKSTIGTVKRAIETVVTEMSAREP